MCDSIAVRVAALLVCSLVVLGGCGGRDRRSGEIDAGGATDGGPTRDAGPFDAGEALDGSERADGGGATDAGGGADTGTAPCGDPDGDDDGYDAVECGGADCDDGDPEVHPGAVDGPDRTWEAIDSIPGSEGDEIDLAVDAAGDVHLAYLWVNTSRTDGSLRYMRFLPTDAVGLVEDAHRTTDPLRSRVGRDGAIALDAAGVPHVSFVDQRTTGAITFFTGSRAGGTWSFESPAGGEQQTSIAVETDATRHIVVNGVNYITNASGTFTAEPVGAGIDPDVVLDAAGSVHVVWAAPAGIRHAVRGAVGFTIASVDDFTISPGFTRPGVTLLRDASDTLHLTYSRGTEIAYARRPAGGAWAIETVTTTTSPPTSITLLSDGRVAIAFTERRTSGETMRFAVSSPSGWHTVDDTEACGCYEVEILERNGRLSAFYSAGGNLAHGTWALPDAIDDDCDGTAW